MKMSNIRMYGYSKTDNKEKNELHNNDNLDKKTDNKSRRS